MTSHGKHPSGEWRPNTANVPSSDKQLYRAWCGRWVPSWSFSAVMEAACQNCRDRATDAEAKAR